MHRIVSWSRPAVGFCRVQIPDCPHLCWGRLPETLESVVDLDPPEWRDSHYNVCDKQSRVRGVADCL